MEKIKEVLKKERELIKLEEKEKEKINKETEKFVRELEKEIKNKKIKADVFIGGSLAKDTLIKKDKYDIDIFVRFDESYDDKKISDILGKILKKAKRIPGSRNYFQIEKDKIIFEVIPVLKINKPEEAKNITDLSYFHVNYIKNKIKKNKKLADEIKLAKSFCYAQNCYGAESYIKGFSGYALELLVSYYGSFLKFIKAVKDKKQVIIDPSKFYKNKKEVMLELNEAKLQSPIIFIDPTFRERNALAALSYETFKKFQEACKDFLKNPSLKFFKKQELEKQLRKKHKNLIIVMAKTNRQKGDIAGSKLKKFYEFLCCKAKKYFEIKVKEFEYIENKNIGKIYLSLKKRKKIILSGPPITAVEHLARFKKKHENCFIRNKRAYATEKEISFNEFLKRLRKEEAIKEMGITNIKLIR